MGRPNPPDHAFEPTLLINHCAPFQFVQAQTVRVRPKNSARKCHAFERERLRASRTAGMGRSGRETKFCKSSQINELGWL